jgi:hypothetical protein
VDSLLTSRTLVRATMLVATLAWAGGEALMRRPGRLDELARSTWTAGVVLACLHVFLAFYLVYGWDHEAAVAATVQQSAGRFGTGWRGAIYLNYLFVMLWLADVCWWWIRPAAHRSRPIWIERTRFLLFAFMFVNGAIVFAAGAGRLVGIVAVGIAAAGHMRRLRSPAPPWDQRAW